MDRRNFLGSAAAAAIAALPVATLPATGAFAQGSYPERPVRLIVPFAPGGTTDILARVLSEQLAKGFGQSFVVENREGAGSAIGAAVAAKSAADGYTLVLVGISTLALVPAASPDVGYDPLKSFDPVALVSEGPAQLLVVPPSLEAKTLVEFIALMKASPGKYNYGTTGPGSLPHAMAASFTKAAGVEIQAVHYRSEPQALLDLTAGRLAAQISSVAAVGQFVQSGQLVPLAATGPKRLAAFPNIPTLAEALPGYPQGLSFNMILAPAGTPAPIVARVNEQLRRALAEPEVRTRLEGMGFQAVADSTPASARAYLEREVNTWTPIVKSLAPAK